MKTVYVILLSGACCNPGLAPLDEKIHKRIMTLADDNNIKVNLKTVTISAASAAGLGLGRDADEAVRSLIIKNGLSVLPVIIFNGVTAFYGGLASAEIIAEKLKESAV